MKHIIVGGGINGLFTAYYLQQAGEQVVIVDQGDIGRESSWAGGGILSPLYPWRYPNAVTQLANWSQQAYPEIVAQLTKETSIDPQLLRSGMLILDKEDKDQALSWAKEQDKTLIDMTYSQCKAQFPQVALPKVGGLWMPLVGQVRNPRLIKALVAWLKAQGVRIIRHEKVLELLTNKNHITGIRTTNQSLSGSSVCITAGAWAGVILQQFGNKPDIFPVKGQMLLLQSTPDMINHIVLKDSHYIIPRVDGKILVGSTLEYVGFDKTTSQDAKTELLRIAYSMMPKLENCSLKMHWAGLRPGSKDGCPTICKHPDISGLYINGGQFRNGVVLAPASGKLTANIMLAQKPIINPSAYQLTHSTNNTQD